MNPFAKLTPLIALLAAAAPAPPASAVVGGQRVAASSVPWFVGTGICGGTLIAPARIATAAHLSRRVTRCERSAGTVHGSRRVRRARRERRRRVLRGTASMWDRRGP